MTLSLCVTVKLACRAQPTVDGPADWTLRWREEIVDPKTQMTQRLGLLMTQRRRELVDARRANGVTSNLSLRITPLQRRLPLPLEEGPPLDGPASEEDGPASEEDGPAGEEDGPAGEEDGPLLETPLR